jgi:hypothetical protein
MYEQFYTPILVLRSLLHLIIIHPLIAFGATSTIIEPLFAGDVSILVGQPPIGFHQLMNPLELSSGIEPNYLDYKSSASPAML